MKDMINKQYNYHNFVPKNHLNMIVFKNLQNLAHIMFINQDLKMLKKMIVY